jgi:hypothetical protein
VSARDLSHLSDHLLLRVLESLAAQDRLSHATLRAAFAEADSRGLSLSEDVEACRRELLSPPPAEPLPRPAPTPRVLGPPAGFEIVELKVSIRRRTLEKLRYAYTLMGGTRTTVDAVLDFALDVLIEGI